jgi:hypothetical protein
MAKSLYRTSRSGKFKSSRKRASYPDRTQALYRRPQPHDIPPQHQLPLVPKINPDTVSAQRLANYLPTASSSSSFETPPPRLPTQSTLSTTSPAAHRNPQANDVSNLLVLQSPYPTTPSQSTAQPLWRSFPIDFNTPTTQPTPISSAKSIHSTSNLSATGGRACTRAVSVRSRARIRALRAYAVAEKAVDMIGGGGGEH